MSKGLNIFLACFSIFSVLVLSSCNKDKIHEQNIAEIQQYLENENLTAQSTESGLHYIITQEGDGNFPIATSDVTVNYTGYLTNKTIFDQSQGISFNLQQVIAGWTEGIPLISKGGSAILLIPSRLAYGSRATGSIPANAVLIFEVDLLDYTN